jgi:hypothetical protein
MADYRTLYGSEYITAVEFNGKTPTLTIASVAKVTLLDPDTQAPKTRGLIKFKEVERGMVANRTNLSFIAAMFGNDTDAWVGKRISLRAEEVQVGPKRDLGIRVFGSPDIPGDIKTMLNLPRKKPREVLLRATGNGKGEAQRVEPDKGAGQ